MNKSHLILTMALIVLIILPSNLYACAVCFGGPETSITEGLKLGMLFLLLLVGIVLGGISAFVWTMNQRAKQIKKHELEEAL